MKENPFEKPENLSANPGLVDADELLKVIWPSDKSRPSLRWLRQMQASRRIPYIRLGRRIFFDPTAVRRVIEQRHTVKAA
jgi:hypothetical protein